MKKSQFANVWVEKIVSKEYSLKKLTLIENNRFLNIMIK